ncbi:MAG: 3'-5' exonuclease, partial [Eubacteriales bacterium]
TKKELTKTQEYAQTIKRLVLKYYQKYGEFKLEKKLMDFTDIERYAIKILEHQEVAREYQDKFEYIFIDEYQDSNPVQEKLIGLIKRKDNVFMVGDVKQSIYKFRQADPKLFEDKYKFFRDVDCAHNKKIDLNANFRSKKTVIDSVNSIFEVLMGDSYDDAARLNVGIEYDGEHKHKTEIHIIEDRGVYIEDISDEQAELLDEFDKYEKEASIIAKIVKSNVGKQIYDTKLDCVRTVELKDIVVLLRNARGIGEKFQKIFEMNDIQSYIGDSEGYFDTLEIKIIINFLKVIDNRRSDIPLISMLVSSVFDFTYDEIAKIRIEHPDGTFYEAFVKYGEKNEKAASVLKKIDEWVKLSEVLTISDFIWELMHSSGYYLFVSALPNAIQRQANLRMLLQKAQDFQDMNIRGLHEFLNYVDALKAKSVRIGQVSTVSEDDNVLRIMTIHKSKGLEFPIVIVAGLGREWKNRKDASGLVFNKDMGFAFEFSDEEKHYKRKTAWQNEIIKQNEREALEEEKRILYVAFTRAQDKLVLVGTKKIKEKNDEENDVKTDLLKLDEPKTYMDMVLNAVENSRTVETIVHEYDEIEIVAKENDEKNAKKIQILESVELEKDVHKSSELYKIIDKKLSFEYVNLKGTALKSKFSVSELNADIEEDDDEISLNEPNFGIAENAVITRAQRGTIYHTLLEHWDFKHAVDCLSAGEKNLKSYAQNLLVNLKEKNILFENEVKLCEGFLKSVYWLTKTELGKRMARAKFLKKEASFILEKEIQGQNVIVQGTIDCFFEDENGLVLVDYKTGNHENVEDSKLKERYQKQIDLYRQALCESFEERVKEAYLVFVDDKKVISM